MSNIIIIATNISSIQDINYRDDVQWEEGEEKGVR